MEEYKVIQLAPYEYNKNTKQVICKDMFDVVEKHWKGKIIGELLDELEGQALYLFTLVKDPKEMSARLKYRLWGKRIQYEGVST